MRLLQRLLGGWHLLLRGSLDLLAQLIELLACHLVFQTRFVTCRALDIVRGLTRRLADRRLLLRCLCQCRIGLRGLGLPLRWLRRCWRLMGIALLAILRWLRSVGLRRSRLLGIRIIRRIALLGRRRGCRLRLFVRAHLLDILRHVILLGAAC
ncbi:MAG: hypothetical protein WDN28_19635 [Chthoniobacter sp.]